MGPLEEDQERRLIALLWNLLEKLEPGGEARVREAIQSN
jgi:hypothetical protein